MPIDCDLKICLFDAETGAPALGKDGQPIQMTQEEFEAALAEELDHPTIPWWKPTPPAVKQQERAVQAAHEAVRAAIRRIRDRAWET